MTTPDIKLPTRYNLVERLWRIQRALGIDRKGLAANIGVSYRTIEKWRGKLSKPSLENLKKIHALEMRVGLVGQYKFRKNASNAIHNAATSAALAAAKPFFCGTMVTRNSRGRDCPDLPHPCRTRVAHEGDKCPYHQPGSAMVAKIQATKARKRASREKAAQKAEVEAILAAAEARRKALADQRWATRRKNYPKLEATVNRITLSETANWPNPDSKLDAAVQARIDAATTISTEAANESNSQQHTV